jgi:hypothetical protein
MKKTLCRSLPVLCVALAVVLLGAVSFAQDVYSVNYYSNAITTGVPDGTVRIDNPGETYGTLCAMVYVFAPDQQMAECCGCAESHNDLNTLSAAVNGAPCDPTTNVTPTPDLRAWVTHIQNVDIQTGLNPITETESLDASLSAGELAALQSQCSFINILGSGHGICTCGNAGNKRKH